MSLYRKKSELVEAITFDELVEYGKKNGGNIVSGMPWSFTYMGRAITHENDNCYLVCLPRGTGRFERGEVLVTEANGAMNSYKADEFAAKFESV